MEKSNIKIENEKTYTLCYCEEAQGAHIHRDNGSIVLVEDSDALDEIKETKIEYGNIK